MTAKDFKHLINQEVFVIPTGNSVQRKVPLKEQIVATRLLKAGVKNLLTTLGNYAWDGAYNQNSYGYKHFTSKQAAEEYLLSISLRRKLVEMLQRESAATCSYTNLLKIEEILTNDNTL